MMRHAHYDEWSDLLFRLEAAAGPAELQGMLYGRLSGGQRLAPSEWLNAAVEFMDLLDQDPQQALDDESRAGLVKLYEECLSALENPNQPIYLLLPSDEVSLGQRIEALASWCEGFLHGVGSSGLDGNRRLPAEVAEALRDMAQIAQAELEEDEDEENEHYYAELVEYVRVAVLTLYGELNPPPRQLH